MNDPQGEPIGDCASTPKEAMVKDKIELTVLMPCLNEAETIATCIGKAQLAMRDYGITGEVLVADNGSTDGSQQIATQQGGRVVHVEQKGYGSALLGGIQAARGTFVIIGDADDSYNFLDIPLFVEKLRDGYELVMGNRFAGGIAHGAMPILHKYLGNPLLSRMGKLFFHCPCNDFHCGLRGFSKSAVIELDLRTTGMEFASEMVVKATLHKMRITEVPTTLSRDGRSHPPHLRTWRDGWRHLRFMLMYSPRWMFLYPGIVLMLLGLISGLWLWPGPSTIGNVEYDVHALIFSAAAVLIGYQAVVFAFLSKIFAITEGLLPEDPRMNQLFKFFTLEVGLLAGSMLLLLGILGSAWAICLWSVRTIETFDSPQTLRIIVHSVLALTLGCQTILFSFFFSVLGLRRKSKST